MERRVRCRTGGCGVIQDGADALLALQETGSVTAAAGRCHLTQPALTRRLQRLSAAAGVAVVERRGRGVVLTAAGESLASLARRQRDDWERTLAGLREAGSVPMRLGCGSSLALTLLPAALARLDAKRGGPPLRVLAGDSAATAARLLADEIDAGLVTTAAADRRIRAWPLTRDAVVAVGPLGLPPVRTLAELAAGPLCLYVRGTGLRGFQDGLFAAAGLFPEPLAEIDSLEALRELVVAGLGRSLLPRSVAAPAAAAGRLRLLAVDGLQGAGRTIALLCRSDRAVHPRLAELHAALRAVVARDDAGGPGEARP